MADLSFNMVYASIPFLNDDARTFQFSRSEGEREGRSPVRDQQSEGYLWDDMERLIPTDYLQDMGYPECYPGRNTGSLAKQHRAWHPPRFKLGDFFYPNTATRWSYFRYLATSSQVKAMLAATAGNKPQTFTIASEPVSAGKQGRTYTVSTPMYMLPPRPLGEQQGTFDGLYLITLVDERYFWQQNPVLFQPNFDTTWTGLISQIATSLKVSITCSAIPAAYLSPEPDSHLWVNYEDASLLLDAIAYNIGRVVVRYFDGTYALLTPQESLSSANTSRFAGTNFVLREAGGDVFYSGSVLPVGSLQKSRNIAPTAVRVTFPKYVVEDPVPHFAVFRGFWTRWFEDSYEGTYFVDTPISSGGANLSGLSGSPAISGLTSGNGIHTVFNTAKALYDTDATAESGNPTNLTRLQALAAQITEDYYAQTDVDGLDEVYLGILNWTPEGLHDIVFTWSAKKRLATTRVVRSEYNLPVMNMQHCTPADSEGVGYPWVPGIAILSGYTISNQGNSGVALNLNLNNININGGDNSITNLFINSGVTFNIEGGEGSSFEWEDLTFDWTDVTINTSNVHFNFSNLMTFEIQEGAVFTITDGGNPNTNLTIDLTTIDWTELTALTITDSGGLTITTSGNPEKPLIIRVPVINFEENTLFVIEEGTTWTFQNSNPGGDPVTVIIEYENTAINIDHNTTIEGATTWTILGDDEETSFFVIQGTSLVPLTFNIINSAISITGDHFLDISSLLIINGPTQMGYVTQDPVTTDQSEFTILETAPINRIPINGTIDITGMSVPENNRSLWNTIINVGTGTGTIKDSQGAGSFDIRTPGGDDMTIAPGAAFVRWYDPVSSLNRVFFAGGEGGGATGFSGTKDVVISVFCSGNNLTVNSETWYFEGGLFLSGG